MGYRISDSPRKQKVAVLTDILALFILSPLCGGVALRVKTCVQIRLGGVLDTTVQPERKCRSCFTVALSLPAIVFP